MSERKHTYNLSAGPSHLPDEVLEKARREMLNWQNHGTSVMEISHRTPEIEALSAQTKQRLRDLLKIPARYEIIYMQGGGRLQFAALPLNLHGDHNHAQYLEMGLWSQLAATEAKRFIKLKRWHAWKDTPAEMADFTNPASWPIDPSASYVHYTTNETVHGIQCPDVRLAGAKKIAVDMSSDILSREINIENYDLIYACAQKTLGIAGITFVILNPDCIEPMNTPMPSYLEYARQIECDSMWNTPPTFALYMSNLVLEWIQQQGGVVTLEARNLQRANKIYKIIDQYADFYHNPVPQELRSAMNITCHLPSTKLETQFVEQAAAAGLMYVKGHRVYGGIRMSLYNYQSDTAINCLLEFLEGFYHHNH